MGHEAARRVTEFLHDRIEADLRTVVVIREDGHDIHYLREDLRERYDGETYGDVVDTFRLEDPYTSPGVEDQPVGERRGIVHYHEHAFVIQFPVSDAESVLISLSRDSGQNLLEFLETCRHRVVESS
ncbi:hypothetical protein [Natronomonas gomsonensis]|uniref:hypothetical protein n=1 Tax=Natronomonas gomsonensis TaxID=1046043 RepID=UPI0015BC8160|nr:hypothetical protein [Natronomonas gomsonensis]